MDTKLRSKAEWAASKADEFRSTAAKMRYRSSGGSFSRAARKGQAMAHLHSEAARFDRMAASYRARGL